MRGAGERGLTNLVPTQGDATALPYEDASVDAVVLTAVLGEIPDTAAALREIRRVLRPSGRLVVGELFGDPHFTTLASLKRQAAEADLSYEEHSGNWFAYFARLGQGKRLVLRRLADFAAFFDRGAGWDLFAAAAGPDRVLEEPEDEAGGSGDHQDQADRVDADPLDVDVGRELEDRADGNQENCCGNGHGAVVPPVARR